MSRKILSGLALLLAMPAMAQENAEALAQQKELLTLQRDIAQLKGELADQKFGFLKEIQLPKSELKMGDGAMEAVVLAGQAARGMAEVVKVGVKGRSPILLLAPGERLALDLGALMEGRIGYSRNALETVLKGQCLVSDPVKDEVDPDRISGGYPDKQDPGFEVNALGAAGVIIPAISSLLSTAFSVEVNVKDVPISTDAGFLWAEVAKQLHKEPGIDLITPSLALGLPQATGGALYDQVFSDNKPESIHRLFGKATACLGILSKLKSDKAKAAAAKVKAVTDATDSFVKAVSAPDAKGVVPLLEADRQKTLTELVKTAYVLRLTIHQAGGAQMTRKAGFGSARVSMAASMLLSYTLAKPDGKIDRADTFICGFSIEAGKGIAWPDDVGAKCNGQPVASSAGTNTASK